MAKIQDKLYNRIIEGELFLQPYKVTFELGTDFTYNSTGIYHFTSSGKAKIVYLLKNFAVIGCRVVNEIYNVTPISLLLFNEEAYNENVPDYYICFISLLEDKFTIPKVCQSVLHYWTGAGGGATFEMRVKDNYDNAEGTDSVEDISKIELYGLIRV